MSRARRHRRPRSRAGLAAGACAAAAHLVPIAFRLGIALHGRGTTAAGGLGAPVPLPAYTVLGPLHREAERVRSWLDAVAALRYPRDRLDVQLLVEADDVPTRRAADAEAARRGDPPWLRVVVVPPDGPRTKPHALQHGLAAARGELLVVFDAEDLPDPDQLLAAAAGFAAAPSELACLQARLVIPAAGGGAFARLMSAEYRLWHGGFLPGLARRHAPVPLAGTSNHLRVAPLRALGGWDPANVAEDADLGIRLARAGLRTATLASTTVEDGAPEGVRAWVRQRSRWSKGFAQTWRAARRPRGALRRELGPARAACVHLTLAGTLATQLTTPVLAGVPLAAAGLRAARGRAPRPGPAGGACALVAAAGMAARLAGLAVFRDRDATLRAAALAAPLYWVLEGVAAWRGMHGLVRHPHRWDKTEHPVRASRAPAG